MEKYDFLLLDRIAKIQAINMQYDLENNAYISFSGGKDSTILHYLIDMALPGNNIPRVYINTGIEYNLIVKYVKDLAKKDNRIIILNNNTNLKKMWLEIGYPFKSKQHSHMLAIYQRHKEDKQYNLTINKYLGLIECPKKFVCPKILKYQFTPSFNLKCSDMCCTKLKKEPLKNWSSTNNKKICITGMRREEGGQRTTLNCTIFKDNELKKFHPLVSINEEWEDTFLKMNNIKLCDLYYEPYNFKRTGCKGCPFALELQRLLDIMENKLPNEKKQCEILWKPVYSEYRKLGYRLRKKNEYRQTTIFDYL